MSVMKSAIPVTGPDFDHNRVSYEERVADMRARRAAAMAGGSAGTQDRLHETNQMLARERVSALLDPGSPFLELCQLAGEGLFDGLPPGGE